MLLPQLRKLQRNNELVAKPCLVTEPFHQESLDVQEQGLCLTRHRHIDCGKVSVFDQMAELEKEVEIPTDRSEGIARKC